MPVAVLMDSCTEAGEPPIRMRYRPPLTVPDLIMAMGAFFNTASVE